MKREITATSLHWNNELYTSSRWGIDALIKHVTDIEISSKESKLVYKMYYCVLTKNYLDLMWNIMHGVIPTRRFLWVQIFGFC